MDVGSNWAEISLKDPEPRETLKSSLGGRFGELG